MRFDKARKALAARRAERIGAVVLSGAPVAVEPGENATAMLLDAVRAHGLSLLPFSREVAQFRDRLSWLNARLGEPWPAMDEAALAASLDEWLAPYLAGATGFDALTPGMLKDALSSRVPYELISRLDEFAPSRFVAPTGTSVMLDYGSDGADPEIAIRVQELFGLKEHPAIAGGKVPLTVELLSPAQRPIQRTKDLPSFWSGSWAAVRADLRGRYPKHPWPADPANAEPTRRAKPRN